MNETNDNLDEYMLDKDDRFYAENRAIVDALDEKPLDYLWDLIERVAARRWRLVGIEVVPMKPLTCDLCACFRFRRTPDHERAVYNDELVIEVSALTDNGGNICSMIVDGVKIN